MIVASRPASDMRRAGLEVRAESIRRTYGSVPALDGLSLTIQPGELVALLGPSGCGKTTALRILAGLEDSDGGRVIVGGRDVTAVPAHKRDMGMVFQAYSLFPHLTAFQNVEFGLRLRRLSAAERRSRAGEMLELVGLSAQAGRYPRQMSGGQQQRVALARALAIRPTVLLLDEPLAALDALVRVQLRGEIRRIQLEVGTTTLFVTHDQDEALAIADRVGVMHAGRLEQLDRPADIYARPKTPFVASFIGLSNQLPATVKAGRAEVLGTQLPLLEPGTPEGAGTAVVRPEAITLSAGPRRPASAATIDGVVVSVTFLGAISHVHIRLESQSDVIALLPSSEAASHAAGDRVGVAIRNDPVLIVRD